MLDIMGRGSRERRSVMDKKYKPRGLWMVFEVTSSNCKVKIARFYEFLLRLG